ncbi:hypothetical protein LhelvAHU1049_08690 [Lactobacillus helveticus]|nr:hypothetical protein LhelvAHU1049_08690 [Lactobacillus helveticus]
MAVIELKNVEKIYGKGDARVEALKDINFEADKSELVLIMGPSGAGKSTFLTIAGSLQKTNFRPSYRQWGRYQQVF